MDLVSNWFMKGPPEKMKTTNTTTKFGAATLATAALLFGSVGVAGAQEADPAGTTNETTETEENKRTDRRSGKKALIAEVLDITPEELSEQREAGATLAEIAGDQVDEVVSALVDNAEERIAARVESGRITQEQADERLADLEERITERVETGERGERGERGPRGERPGRRGLTQS